MVDDLNNDLKNSLELEGAILQCAKILVTEIDEKASLDILLKTVNSYYHASKSYIFEIDKNNDYLYCTFEYKQIKSYYNNQEDMPIIPRIDIKVINIWYDALVKNKELYIDSLDDIDKHSIEYKILSSQHIKNIIAVPLYKNNKFFGFIGMTNPQKNLNNLYLLKTIGAFTVNEIEKRIINNKLTKKVAELEETLSIDKAMLKCATILLKGSEIKYSINKLLETIADFYIADRVYIFEINYDRKTFSNTYEYCIPNVQSQRDIMQSKNLDIIMNWFKLFKQQDVLNIQDVKKDDKFDKTLIQSDKKYRDYLKNIDDFVIKPLIKNNQVLGFLGMNNKKNKTNNYKLLDNVSAFIINDIKKRDMIKELQQMSFIDGLTGLYNRNQYSIIISKLEDKPPTQLGIIYADVNGLKRVNDKLGHDYGDLLIKWAGDLLSSYINEPIFRLGGDEFIAIIENTNFNKSDFFKLVTDMRLDLKNKYAMNMSIGSIWKDKNENKDVGITELIALADADMYRIKKIFYKNKSQNYKNNLENELASIKWDLEKYGLKKSRDKSNLII
ncbi:MAG: GGDEF domain-containing protein [bacterium]